MSSRICGFAICGLERKICTPILEKYEQPSSRVSIAGVFFLNREQCKNNNQITVKHLYMAQERVVFQSEVSLTLTTTSGPGLERAGSDWPAISRTNVEDGAWSAAISRTTVDASAWPAISREKEEPDA
jgi:hypothetical protein